MRAIARGIACALAGVTLAACGSIKDDLGLEKKAPDEFAVVRNAPLSLPPNFNLRPPKPGEVGDGRLEQRDQARALLTGRSPSAARATQAALTAPAPRPEPAQFSYLAGRSDQRIGELSEYTLLAAAPAAPGGPAPVVATATASRGPSAPGERALLSRLEADNPDPNIRRRVDEEARLLAADDRTFVEKMMFWRQLNPPGVLVEPEGENRRLQENSALGKPATEGETPEIRVERLSTGFSGIRLF